MIRTSIKKNMHLVRITNSYYIPVPKSFLDGKNLIVKSFYTTYTEEGEIVKILMIPR